MKTATSLFMKCSKALLLAIFPQIGIRTPLLKRFRRPLAAWLQLVCMTCWIIQPTGRLRAAWVPDENGAPVWVPLAGEATQSPPAYDAGDADGNGIADWLDQFNTACTANALSYWNGGTFVVDGVATTYGGVWHATSPDTDGDLIPDDLDPYPSDSTNNSFFWSGGAFTYAGVSHSFRSGWYQGSAYDGNGNGVPDVLDDWFTNPSAHGTLQSWSGGTFTINGQPSTFDGVSYYSPAYVDSDGDGIPDELDPYPSDPWNNTSINWQGGDYAVNGVLTHFAPGIYGGAWADSDGDGIPDQVDPLPGDANNNSVWWQGGSYTIDGMSQTFPAQWHRADAGDSDGDGIPDDIDPLPYSADNWHSFYWGGGNYWVNNQQQYFSPGDYYGSGVDSDGDGIPDAADPYPGDPSNGNVTAEYTWAGGSYLIANEYQTLSAGTYSGSWQDSDGDGIPDPADPYPYDSGNGNSQFYWEGGWFYFNNQCTYFSPGYYAGVNYDSDFDGVPDVCDMYPGDSNNGNATYSWAGGSFRIDNSDVWVPGGTYVGCWSDADGDGIPDGQDPYPNDPNNNNSTAATSSFYWSGGTYRINNIDQSFSEGSYDGTWSDADGDGIPDSLDAYPGDPANGNTTFYWAGGIYRIANINQYFAAGTYPGVWADTDGDEIPDTLDPYPSDSTNANTHFYWAGGTYHIDNQNQAFYAGYYDGDCTDTDGDGIPDSLDAYPNDPGNGNTQFHWQGGYFVIDNVGKLFADGNYNGVWADSDGDGLPDPLDPYPNDAGNGNTTVNVFYWAGGSFYVNGACATWVPGDYPGDLVDTDGDGIPDSLDLYPQDATNNSAFWSGGDFAINGFFSNLGGAWHRADAADSDGDGIPDDLDPYPTDAANHPGFDWPSVATSYSINNQTVTFQPSHYGINWVDSDGDGIPDIADPYPFDGCNQNDTDGDGIPDSIELQYPGILDPNSPSDAANVRADGLTYLQACQMYPGLPLDQSLDPSVDSDHDGIPDLVELLHGLNPFEAADAAASKMGDFVSNLEKYQLGLDMEVAVTQSEYESITGQLWDQFLVNHNQQLADAEDDPDGDGISNIDELLLFHTNPHDAGSRPDDGTIIAAILSNQVSATTLIHYNSLITDGGGSGGGDTGGGTGGDMGSGGTGGGSGGGGTGDGSNDSGGGDSGSGAGTSEERVPYGGTGFWDSLLEPDCIEAISDTVIGTSSVTWEVYSYALTGTADGHGTGIRLMRTRTYEYHQIIGISHFHVKITHPDGSVTYEYREEPAQVIYDTHEFDWPDVEVQFVW